MVFVQQDIRIEIMKEAMIDTKFAIISL